MVKAEEVQDLVNTFNHSIIENVLAERNLLSEDRLAPAGMLRSEFMGENHHMGVYVQIDEGWNITIERGGKQIQLALNEDGQTYDLQKKKFRT